MVSWCESNNLVLNVSKTKEIVVDFRANKIAQPQESQSFTAYTISKEQYDR